MPAVDSARAGAQRQHARHRIAKFTPFFPVPPQSAESDLGALVAQGFRATLTNRPGGEAAAPALAAAARRGDL
jgi:protein tyrosine phosphatase (PTP) superfamily phosphohydrolase (DUF442 family)